MITTKDAKQIGAILDNALSMCESKEQRKGLSHVKSAFTNEWDKGRMSFPILEEISNFFEREEEQKTSYVDTYRWFADCISLIPNSIRYVCEVEVVQDEEDVVEVKINLNKEILFEDLEELLINYFEGELILGHKQGCDETDPSGEAQRLVSEVKRAKEAEQKFIHIKYEV